MKNVYSPASRDTIVLFDPSLTAALEPEIVQVFFLFSFSKKIKTTTSQGRVKFQSNRTIGLKLLFTVSHIVVFRQDRKLW